ncbi:MULTISPECIES: polysaccharide biosynthesis/export family protein [Ensifer]|uniref:Polysaccharide export protein n=1 Tax=Ensifer canadensis TaxID=555315 RepID=A0AAW4FKL9_9HYPH|nr:MULTISPECIES: polysaccharide biosynthesis/export family protein [Ensifer]AHK43361.1 putative polysaccharide biosynthesis/export protein [Ensifer adhaerens OV14]MDP9628469.1 polysaccharide export outer membrane protein [Ensifer adhaerens]KQU98146.1 capsule biosynthesis protein [Ensifer sp. Root31]KQW62904.1 capsule biosynthesis protein [Ensifer sp. Root1252]KQW84921.1 capsule biosynthesis protein [Ensifer sp. Root127]
MKRVAALLLSTALAGCQAVPGEGPLAGAIVADAGQSGAEIGRKNATVFDIVDVTGQSARLVSDYVSSTLNRRFGIGGGVGRVVIGVGDALKVSIFEAGSDGLFSTQDSKQTSIDLVVQPDGKAAIPYVGSVRFAGLTLEQARQEILEALKQKAVEPDVIVTSMSTASRNVTVSGAVGKSAVVPLSLVDETINEVIAKAGGPVAQPYETYVTLVRGKKTGTVLLKSIIENPSENIHVKPGDQIFVARDPRRFTILGAVKANQRVEFGANDLNLLEAMGLAGGGSDYALDMKGYFIFRYEEPDVVMSLLGQQRFNEMLRKGMQTDSQGRYPIVYRFDMSKPDSLIVGQTFPIKNRDVIYASRHPSVDFSKFLNFVAQPVGIANSGFSIADNLNGN